MIVVYERQLLIIKGKALICITLVFTNFPVGEAFFWLWSIEWFVPYSDRQSLLVLYNYMNDMFNLVKLPTIQQ